MSRGPGRWQRAILDTLAEHEAVAVTHPSHTHAEQNAIRRAAYKLEAAGKINLVAQRVDGRPRLVAYRPDSDVPDMREVTGLDGKTYRMPR
ncbi:hypothetical protein GCM10011490_06690 [Pseudoclavibacter endophyticus]|uniref:MarR family transcriptional regulator n=1 Tax=Pseudoclavibacter endophyticus TaxID=1778590 RepID=A0A6H9WQ64_9MICO|nr:hypothetical protein [Pseudoclavibacter endophyticus]KAB1649841.1 hypothetical protein F8O04_06330 [Pseudoclavibacter endophyticus]GGA59354.1 hypothetical protein GCM10011490_06690 [Pseudoclavibacter endophyticus]